MSKMKGERICGSVFATENESSEGELGEKMSSGRALRGVRERESGGVGGVGGRRGEGRRELERAQMRELR